MSSKQLKQKMDNIWKSLKGLRAQQIENHIQLSRQVADSIVSVAQIQRIRNTSILKFIVYELITFCDEIYQLEKEPYQIENQESQNQRSDSFINLQQLKQLIAEQTNKNINSINSKLDSSVLITIQKKVKGLQQQIKQVRSKTKMKISKSQDIQGTQAMIEQLQYLLKKKEARIKQLNNELQQNFNDKQELQNQIQILQEKNVQLQEQVKSLEKQCQKVQEEFQLYKVQQKQQLLFGASEFMSHQIPHKQTQTTINQQENKIPVEMLNSTQVLSRYCQNQPKQVQEVDSPTRKQSKMERKTVKKAVIRQIDEQRCDEDDDLLESMRIYHKKPELTIQQLQQQQPQLSNQGNELERMLLMQATFIEKVMESLTN